MRLLYRRILLAICVAMLAFSAVLLPVNTAQAVTSTPTDRPASQDGRVVLILTSKLHWSEFDTYDAPHLRQLAENGLVGNLVPPSLRGPECPIDSWLIMNAGKKRGRNSFSRSATCILPDIVPGQHVDRYSYVSRMPQVGTVPVVATANLKAIGMFTDALNQGGLTSHPIGTGAAYTLATSDGFYPMNWEDAPLANAELSQRVAASAQTYNVTVVDAESPFVVENDPVGEEESGEFDDPEKVDIDDDDEGVEQPTVDEELSDEEKEEQARALLLRQAHVNAQRVNDIIAGLPDGTRVIVASLVDRTGKRQAQITIMGDKGPTSPAFTPIQPALMYSVAVRQAGTVQLYDIPTTILSLFDISSLPGMTGTPITADSEECADAAEPCLHSRIDDLIEDSTRYSLASKIRTTTLPVWQRVGKFFFLASLIILAAPLRRHFSASRSDNPRAFFALRAFMWLGFLVVAFPLASLVVNVLPWWNARFPLVTYIVSTFILAAVLAAIALWARRLNRFAPAFILFVPTTIFLVADTLTGARAMSNSAIGFSTLMGARFYGLGNEPYSVLAAASLFILPFIGVWLRSHYNVVVSALGVGLFGGTIAAVDALPRFGADFGGALSYVPALLVLILLLFDVRFTLRRIAILAGSTLALGFTIAFIDWIRPEESRTHLGRFVQSIVDGRLFEVVGGKLSTNIHLLTTSAYRSVVFLALLVLILALIPVLRSRTLPEDMRHVQSWAEVKAAWTERDLMAGMSFKARIRRRVQDVWTALRRFQALYWGWLYPRTESEGLMARVPALRLALVAELVCFTLAFALNDSGIVLPGVGFLVLLPVIIILVFDEKYDQNVPSNKDNLAGAIAS